MPPSREDVAELAGLLGLRKTRLRSPKPVAFRDSTDQIAARLAVKPELADALLDEAKDHHEFASDRAESAERRATTLQGAVAIAASLTVAGGSLLLDSGKLQGLGWKLALGTGLLGITLCLVMAGYRAVTATARLYSWASPDPEDIYAHAGLGSADAVKAARAADLLKSAGINQAVATRKVIAMSEAAIWFTRALFLILVLSLVLLLYAAVGQEESAKKDSDKEAPAAKQAPAGAVGGRSFAP